MQQARSPYVIPRLPPQTFPAQIPEHECRCETCGKWPTDTAKALLDIRPQQHAVIQIKTGDYRGTLWLVGEVEGETVHCYRITPGGDKEFHETKFGEFHLISQVQKGMVAWKYEKPIKEKAPSWHEEDRPDQV